MGLCFSTVIFETPAPSFEEITAKIEEISGLSVSFSDVVMDESITDFDIRFECAPEVIVELRINHHGGARGLKQSVEVTDGALSEPTLHMITVLALEALGGTPIYDISIEDGKFKSEMQQLPLRHSSNNTS